MNRRFFDLQRFQNLKRMLLWFFAPVLEYLFIYFLSKDSLSTCNYEGGMNVKIIQGLLLEFITYM